MSDTRYRRGRGFAADMAVYNRQMAPDNDQELSLLKRNLIRALKEDITPRQRETMLLYYGQGLNMREIGLKLGVDKSTVSWGKPIDGVGRMVTSNTMGIPLVMPPKMPPQ